MSKTKTTAKTAGGSRLKKWFFRLIAVAVLYVTCQYLDTIKHRWYVFEPESLHQLAKAAIAASPDPNDAWFMTNYIVKNLTETYSPTQVALNLDTSEWFFSNAGGAMGAMYVIHASITEYIIIFGTPVGTEGHTGIHTADDYFNVLVGERWVFSPPNLQMERYPAGSVHHVPRGQMRQHKMHEGCFALEYARGWIPPMMPFGFADILFSTLDYVTFYQTLHIPGRETLKNLLIGKI
ncbi:uncharacterized protein PHACADRAFT_148597 [Phanerochaete carnosa HHB-10118-sp]|uniref:C-8 sterol isomerase n=1 Tax=Phanerochaete carnosa (strain HHB-10118-sp) TaxID=650164 RepID=K5W4E6_PHACS|nr:uncharacterized protein PHACADRAFT_148597 [Phanerochaete carnosa HHB-10118-sp]EKM53794.1 hypothetical protein PHACADRAFT_148597 [Phanerochaete carnosa HHB-10118-sp]